MKLAARLLRVAGLLKPRSADMPRRTVQFVPGEFYHVYNRGNNRETIFFEREWEFSSYRDYVGLRDGSIPRKDLILQQFQTIDDYKRFVVAGIGRIDSRVSDFVFDE
jgi:hypothetical protein